MATAARQVAARANASAQQAATLIEALTQQANIVLSAILHGQQLVGLDPATQGEFPYMYLNTRNLLFNHLTYAWIASALKAGAKPAQLDNAPFSNEYIDVLSKVVYTLSRTDQAALVQAQQNANQQQLALLSVWKQAYGSIPAPTPTMQPIDIILATIANSWATPPTTLTAMQQSTNLHALLNNTPASGYPILPVLANWLNAMGASISLQNQTTMNNSYVQSALIAAQSPVAGNPPMGNGGLALDDNSTVPPYTVTPQPSDILNFLSDPAANVVKSDMAVARATSDEFRVSVSGGTAFNIPVMLFLGVEAGGSATYFSDKIATSSNSVKVSMSFTGCNLVNFGPLPYSKASKLGWAWVDPIRDAIKNGTKDVSGFKFAPTPQVDFSTAGPFGYANAVAIANYPSVEIEVKSADYKSIQQTFEQQSHVRVSFLGIPLASATESTYSSSVTVDQASSTVHIKLSPPLSLVAGDTNQSVAWVLGATLSYPCA